jgi:hypothetical protein
VSRRVRVLGRCKAPVAPGKAPSRRVRCERGAWHASSHCFRRCRYRRQAAASRQLRRRARRGHAPRRGWAFASLRDLRRNLDASSRRVHGQRLHEHLSRRSWVEAARGGLSQCRAACGCWGSAKHASRRARARHAACGASVVHGTRRATASAGAAIGVRPLRHASCGAELGVGTRRAVAGPQLLGVTCTLQRISAAQTAGQHRYVYAGVGTACAPQYQPSPNNGLGCYCCAPAIPRATLRAAATADASLIRAYSLRSALSVEPKQRARRIPLRFSYRL